MSRTLRKRRRRVSRRTWAKLGIGVLVVAGLLVALDVGVGRYQAHLVAEQEQRFKMLERRILYDIRADVADIQEVEGEERWRVTIFMQNNFPEKEPLYVMVPNIRAYIQVGSRWQEVPFDADPSDPLLRPGTVVDLDGRIEVDHLLTIEGLEEGEYYELMPGYKHIRFVNTMFMSLEEEPEEDIANRRDNYYVHLRPMDADLDALRQRVRFRDPPLYIPMPPH